jgi:hypothetical protein
MRTTITLDPDVETLVKNLMAERGMSFKEVINSLLRAALDPRPRVDFSFPSYEMGQPVVPLEQALRVASELEDEEIIRKVSAGR